VSNRARVNGHVLRCIDASAELGCPTVGTFIGRDTTRSVRDNLRDAEAVFAPLVERSRRDVRLVIENCAMQSWHPDGYPGNLAYLPELWDWLIAHGLALNFDPSHLLPLGIDPVVALGDYVEQVAHPTPQGVIWRPPVGAAVAAGQPWVTCAGSCDGRARMCPRTNVVTAGRTTAGSPVIPLSMAR
jgi:hypothetical protein